MKWTTRITAACAGVLAMLAVQPAEAQMGLSRVEYLALQQEMRDRGCGNRFAGGAVNAETRRAVATCAQRLGVANNARAVLTALDIGFGPGEFQRGTTTGITTPAPVGAAPATTPPAPATTVTPTAPATTVTTPATTPPTPALTAPVTATSPPAGTEAEIEAGVLPADVDAPAPAAGGLEAEPPGAETETDPATGMPERTPIDPIEREDQPR